MQRSRPFWKSRVLLQEHGKKEMECEDRYSKGKSLFISN